MNFLRRPLAGTSFWVAVVGIAALGPLAATVATNLRHVTKDSAPAETPARPASSTAVPKRIVARAAVSAPLAGQAAGARPAAAAFGSGLTPAFATLPAPESRIDSALPPVPPNDTDANAFTTGDGRICVLEMEEFRLRSLSSSNSGASFAPEIDVAGGAGQPPIRSYSARLSSDGRLYVAIIAADAAGGLGLRFARSDDMCLSWSQPLTLVQAGDPTHGVLDVVLDSGSSGHVSILYRGDRGFVPYVVSSSDFGVNWTVPIRLDTTAPPGRLPTGGLDLSIDNNGVVHAAYVQDRFGTGSSVFTTSSFDGGQSFEPERNFDLLLPFHGRSERPDLRVAADGSMLLAFWDNGGVQTPGDLLYCLRSTTQGLSYDVSLVVTLPSNTERSFPLALATDPGSPTAFLFTVEESRQLSVYRSTDNGATFLAPPTVLATTASASADGSRPFTRIAWSRVGPNWAVSWSDQAADTYAGLRTEVVLRLTPNDGLSWSQPFVVGNDAPGVHTSSVETVAASSGNSIFVLYRDGRLTNDRSFDLWAARSGTTLLPLVPESRIDTDLAPVSPRVPGSPTIAFDGASNAFVAYPVVDDGPFSSIRVSAISGWGGPTPTALGLGDLGVDSRLNVAPVIAANPDGGVYVAWTSYAPGGQAEIRFNRAIVARGVPSQTATTWLPVDFVLGSFPQEPTTRPPSWQVSGVESIVTATAYVLWSNGDHVFLSTWDEATLSVSTQPVDQSPDGVNQSARFCVAPGSLGVSPTADILISYIGPSGSGFGNTVWATTSENGGQTWEPRVAVRPDLLPGGLRQMELSCRERFLGTTATAGVAYWLDDLGGSSGGGGSGGSAIYASVREGQIWAVPTAITFTANAARLGVPSSVADTVTITARLPFEAGRGEIVEATSFDGGRSFPSLVRLDAAAPDPDALSTLPVSVQDRFGNAFTAWLDESPGHAELAVARIGAGSGPVGSTVTAIYRASTTDPQGAFVRDWDGSSSRIVGTTGTAIIVWRAEGASSMPDAVTNAFVANDLDRDGAPTSVDCNDADSTVRLVPSLVTSVSMTAGVQFNGPPRISWTSQSETSGSSTTYDILSGLLSNVLATRSFDGATCLAHDLAGPPYTDVRTGPSTGNAFYYLVRAVNSCGTGSFGDSTQVPDPRDVLDTPGICP